MKKTISPVLVRLLGFLVLISVSSAVYCLLPDKNTAPTPDTNNQIKQTNIPPITNTLPNTTIKSAETTSTTKPTENIVTIPENLTATLKAADRTYTLRFKPTETLLQAMRTLTARSEQPFMFSGKEYPALGYFVEEINDKKNNPETGEYWIYYVNGQTAKTGISNYQLIQGDLIEWKYEKSQF